MADVKPKRRYDSTGRQAQARRNREAILDAAQRQFLEGGYAATTLDEVLRRQPPLPPDPRGDTKGPSGKPLSSPSPEPPPSPTG